MRSFTHSTRAGFTIIELMVVVAIISMTIGIAAPSMTDAMRDRKASMVARDIVRILRRASALSLGTGRAYMVTFRAQSNINSGRINLYRGTTPNCHYTDWTTVRGGDQGDECPDSNDFCIDTVDPSQYLSNATGEAIRIFGDAIFANLCYQTGRLRHVGQISSAGADFWYPPSLSSMYGSSYGRGVGFVVGRYKVNGDGEPSSTKVGVSRRIFVPFNAGTPRLLQ